MDSSTAGSSAGADDADASTEAAAASSDSPRLNLNKFTIGSHPVTKPCMATPTTLETTQYSAKPLGKLSVKKPNMAGIIHSIMRLVDACRSSAVGIVVIFCITHMDTPTNTGITNGVGSGSARSIHRKLLSMGITL